MSSDLNVVIGASGGIGHAIASVLATQGRQVRGVSRRPTATEGVEHFAADITDRDQAVSALDGAAVAYLAAQPPYWDWPARFPPMLETVLAAAARTGAKLVMVDNLYAYGRATSPMTDTSVEKPHGKKGAVRAQMAARLRQAHRSGEVRVTSGRCSDYFGTRHGTSSITELAIKPAIAGKTMRWVGRLDVPHSVAYLPDVARSLITLGDSDRADGESWILPHAPAVTGTEFLQLVNGHLPTPVPARALSTTMLRLAAPFHRMSREMLDVAYQFNEPFVADGSRFETVFGPTQVTPLDEAIVDTLSAHREGVEA